MPTNWTEEDVAALRAAVASGILTVAFDGPPRRLITYQSLDAMRSLLSEMTREVSSSTTYRRVAFRKGFGRED